MPSARKPRNWFYGLAMLFGLAFTLTTCALGVLMVRSNRDVAPPKPGESGYVLTDLLDRQGMAILAGELAGLAIFSVGAIRIDHVRGRREFLKQRHTKPSGAATSAVSPLRTPHKSPTPIPSSLSPDQVDP